MSHLLLPVAVTGSKERHAALLAEDLRPLTHGLSGTQQPPGHVLAPGSACWQAVPRGSPQLPAPGWDPALCSPHLGQGGVSLADG